ncbi:MAG TPA: TonB family protein [Candidatus Acidoferrum sp.]|nr:TonB family protein [Candidatus Acidoferrum sp.]
MSIATIALRTRPRPALGPALGRSPLPLGTVLVSAVLHLLALGGLGLAAMLWQEPPTKTYIVNLVPAVAAIGRPQGQVSAPALPARPTEAPPAPAKLKSNDLPQREAPVPAPVPPPEMPARRTTRDTAPLPDRPLPSRAAAVPRPGDKELPASALPRASSEPGPVARRETAPSTPAAPPPPLGQAAGSLQGAGTVTLSVSDFPYAWYIQAIHRKIQERWVGQAVDGRQPEIIFVIGADGRLRGLEVGKSSGNPSYDQVALRAVNDANPFPPLPAGFGKQTLKVGLQFVYDPRAR